MPSYRAEPTRPDKAKAIGGVIAVYAVLGALMLLVKGDAARRLAEQAPTVLIDVKEMPPPQPPPKEDPGKAEEEEGAAGKKAEPTEIVAPKPRIEVPAQSPVVAAPIAGSGTGATAGNSTVGTGPGAGGSGTGRGGGGSGGGGGGAGIGSEARLLGGNHGKLPSSILRQFVANQGFGYLWLTISENGRVIDCSVLQTTGSAEVDQALCGLMIRRSRWEAARDELGRPISVKVRYTATWSKN